MYPQSFFGVQALFTLEEGGILLPDVGFDFGVPGSSEKVYSHGLPDVRDAEGISVSLPEKLLLQECLGCW